MTTLAQTIATRGGKETSRVVVAAVAALAGSLVVAGLAQVSIKVPITPVPFTGQTFGVLLVGASLGWATGALALLLYLAEGAIGLPFFAGGAHGLSVLGA